MGFCALEDVSQPCLTCIQSFHDWIVKRQQITKISISTKCTPFHVFGILCNHIGIAPAFHFLMAIGKEKKAGAGKLGRPSTGPLRFGTHTSLTCSRHMQLTAVLHSTAWLDQHLIAIGSAKIPFNKRRCHQLAITVLRFLEPQDLIDCITSKTNYPQSALVGQSGWQTQLFVDQTARLMRAECSALGADADSILKAQRGTPFDLDELITETKKCAPALTGLLLKLMHASKPSREEKLSDDRQHQKAARAAFIVSQIAYSRSQRNNAFQTFLGVEFKFLGLSEAVWLSHWVVFMSCFVYSQPECNTVQFARMRLGYHNQFYFHPGGHFTCGNVFARASHRSFQQCHAHDTHC